MREAVEKVVATFPKVFGLRAFPGRFTISVDHCFLRGKDEREVALYVFTEGAAFCKAAPDELRAQLVAVR